jgi:hypothetical protein
MQHRLIIQASSAISTIRFWQNPFEKMLAALNIFFLS